MRQIFLTAITLCFMSLMASAEPASQTTETVEAVKAEATKAASATQSQLVAATQIVNFDSIEADINASLPELHDASQVSSSHASFRYYNDDDDFFSFGSHNNSLQRLAVFGIFIMPPLAVVAIVFIVLYFKSRNKRTQYEAMARAAQNGVVIPQFPDLPRTSSPYSGPVTLMAVGLGLIIFFVCVDTWQLGLGIGSIPLLIGAAQLLTRILDDRRR